jgi:hypothetical protein
MRDTDRRRRPGVAAQPRLEGRLLLLLWLLRLLLLLLWLLLLLLLRRRLPLRCLHLLLRLLQLRQAGNAEDSILRGR